MAGFVSIIRAGIAGKVQNRCSCRVKCFFIARWSRLGQEVLSSSWVSGSGNGGRENFFRAGSNIGGHARTHGKKKTGLALRPAQSGNATLVEAGVEEVGEVCSRALMSVSSVASTSLQEPPLILGEEVAVVASFFEAVVASSTVTAVAFAEAVVETSPVMEFVCR
jgi:hypothetical protein